MNIRVSRCFGFVKYAYLNLQRASRGITKLEEKHVAYEEYQNYEDFKKAFGEGFETIKKAGNAIDNLPDWDLENLIHILYNKFPHLPEGKSKGAKAGRTETLRRGVKRAIQKRFYAEIYGKPPKQSVFDRDAEAILALNLSDTPYVPPPKPVKTTGIGKTESIPVEGTSLHLAPAKRPRTEKPKSEFGAKVATMGLDEIIAWANELGVPQENIDKHKAKPLGLAKMNLSNLIRARLPK